jgi:phage shock protein C
MAVHTRTSQRPSDTSSYFEDELHDLESLSEGELEALLFEEEPTESRSFLNLPTLTGLSIILVGIAYIFQQMGLWGNGIDLTGLAQMLPWLGGILIILLGFGVLSWRPGQNRKKQKAEKKLAKSLAKSQKRRGDAVSSSSDRRRLTKSRDKKLAGVASGIAEYFGIDPTLVRIAFVVGTVATGGGPFLLGYLIMAFVMPNPDKPRKPSLDERITIIRDS